MPTYEYLCRRCELHFEKFLSMKESDSPQECPECGFQGERLLSLPNVIFKGDDWTSKNLRVKRQMAEKNRRLDQKTRDHVGSLGPMRPNVGGEEVGSWKEAQKLAVSQGKDSSSYEPLVQKEKRGG